MNTMTSGIPHFRSITPLSCLVGIVPPSWRKRVHLVEEEHAGVGRPGAGKQLPHRPLALTDVPDERSKGKVWAR